MNAMNWKKGLLQTGVPAALLAALLFGAGTPLAKILLNSVNPWLLAGLLYLGSGLGLTLYRLLRNAPAVSLPRNEMFWFAGAVLAGGIVAPVMLMIGLNGMPATGASLLLNTEGVFTTLLAWFVFKENFDRRIALGMIAIMSGAVILSWPENIQFAGLLPSFAVVAACFAWSIDNNLTRKVSLTDATWIASVKGLVAGIVNLALAFSLGASLPPIPNMAGAMAVGFLAYGVSLALFVVGLRHLGTARTGAYFSVAPFFGVLLAVLMGEPITLPLLIAGGFMALGIWLHLTEHHEHEHTHELLEHMHEHSHDDHHQHKHEEPIPLGTKHTHYHRHEPKVHSHSHFPGVHHQHTHQ
jgi:drug/metabolite transporter (DMT)-like permease